MNITHSDEAKTVEFKNIRLAAAFRRPRTDGKGEWLLYIKTSESTALCLDFGSLSGFASWEHVQPVKIQVKVIPEFMPNEK